MKSLARIIAIGALACGTMRPAGAQGYHARVGLSGQALSFRGLTPDSIAADQVVLSSTGGFETPDRFAVRCGAGAYCHFFRPGRVLRATPLVASVTGTVWGLGVTGLSFRGSARAVGDAGGDDAWPGREPALQVLEAYLEYERGWLRARGGRQMVSSRLESAGFDGAWARAALDRYHVDATLYGGWGLAQAAAISPTSPALNPFDEWRPDKRQLVAGGDVGWSNDHADVRAEYRREVDPVAHHFVSERAAASVSAARGAVRMNGGIQYNMAEGHVGSADVNLTYLQPRYSVTGGARRYRPFFSLWTLWGAFSPVPYSAISASTEYRLMESVSLRARGERYRYGDAEVSTALVPKLEDKGWRASIGAAASWGTQWSADASYGIDRGPGAAGDYLELSARFQPTQALSMSAFGGALARPLELRYYDAKTRWAGARIDWQRGPEAWLEVMIADDDRERPDEGASSFSQVRVRAGFTVSLGSAADRPSLPPARPVAR